MTGIQISTYMYKEQYLHFPFISFSWSLHIMYLIGYFKEWKESHLVQMTGITESETD